MVDYADIICQAVDEIVSKRLESINYDNTITCSVVDITNAKEGSYTVTDGSINFTAYSVSTEYKVNDVVYVTVPNNDFTKQKIIIGKQVTNDTTPFIFTTPFDTIVDVSTNLIQGDTGIRSLIANNPDVPSEEQTDDEYILHQNVKQLVWEKDFGDTSLVGFTRLGIQGQFRSWLKSYQAKSGDYGYRLILTCEKETHLTTIATSERVLKKLHSDLNETIWGELQTSDEIKWPENMIISWANYNTLSQEDKQKTIKNMEEYLTQILKESYAKYELYLSATDMYGDPYNFQSFYQQEKVFDISNLGKIINMKLEFYQVPESFYSNIPVNQNIYDLLPLAIYDEESWNRVQISYAWPERFILNYSTVESMDDLNKQLLLANMRNHLTLVPYKHPLFETILDPNLFDQDPYICVGYDLSSFDREQASLYTLSPLTYRAGLTNDENTKQVQLRWLHLFDDGQIKLVTEENKLEFEVKWYRYELGNPTVDGYGGVNWKSVESDKLFSYSFLPDLEESQEKIKAVIIYNNEPIYSNIITFNNERYVSNPSTLDQINGLNLWCADNSYGNYRIYNIGGYLEDEDDRNHIRDLECHFNPKEVEASGLLTDATWIMWRVPATGTMIQLTNSETTSNLNYSNLAGMPKFTSIDNITWRNTVPFSIAGTKYFDGIWSDYLYDADTDEIVSIWKGNSANGFFINPLLEYKLKSFYSPSDSNNTISCVILKDGVQYETQKEFTFGTVGNSGTDWSFEIDFDNNETALTSEKEKSLNLTARLYDSTNKDVTEDLLYDVDLNAKVTWKWHADSVNPSKLTLVQNVNKKHKCSISIPNNTTINMNSLLYVECILEGVGDYALTAILPVPIRKWINDEKEYSHVTGATFVNYPSSGYPTYYNNPFKVHIVEKTQSTSVKQNIEKDGSWSLYNPHNEAHVYVGNISEKNILKPAAVYTQGVKQYGLQYSYGGQVCWTQPIFTMQNNYPSRAINEWNGKEIKMDYDKGIIMSPAMAAGKKNSDNTFSGVMLGDWSADDVEGDLKVQTGIYGFDHGAMSYAFKEDGTAFIGKSGFARIKFDGNESTIASESYTANGYGMMIDLDDGFLDILGGHQTGTENIITSTDNNRVGNFLTRKTFQKTGARLQLGISGDPYFRIIADNAHNNTTLIDISNNAYYFQTYDFKNTGTNQKGLKFDLMNNRLEAYDFTLESKGSDSVRIRMSTESEPYFLIENEEPLIYIGDDEFYLQSNNYSSSEGMYINLDKGNILAHKFTLSADGLRLSTSDPYFQIDGSNNTLIYMGDDAYYLQSNDYSSSKGMYIDLENGNILAHKFTLSATGLRLSTTSPYLQIDNSSGNRLINIASGSYYLQSGNYSSGQGMNINLETGKITAYQFQLEAGTGDNKIQLNSSATTYPLQIGQNFKVSWAGVMTSEGATINTAKINSATINNATVNTATINDATVNDATITDVKLYGTIIGVDWSINKEGTAFFGEWSFINNTLYGDGVYISGIGGALRLVGTDGVYLPTPSMAYFGGTSLEEWLETTYQNGYRAGYIDGERDGYGEGYNDGWQAGYDVGSEESGPDPDTGDQKDT